MTADMDIRFYNIYDKRNLKIESNKFATLGGKWKDIESHPDSWKFFRNQDYKSPFCSGWSDDKGPMINEQERRKKVTAVITICS